MKATPSLRLPKTRLAAIVPLVFFAALPGMHAADAPAASTAPATPVAPSEWIDPATGHRIVRLGKEPGTASLYFHQNAYSPDGKKMIIVTPEGLAALDLQTRAIDLLAPGFRITMSTSNGIEVSRKEPVVYYSVNNNGRNIVYAMNMDTHVWKEAATLPAGAVLGGVTADDAMLIGIRNVGGRGGGAAVPAAINAGSLSRDGNITLGANGALNLGTDAQNVRAVGNMVISGGTLNLAINPTAAANITGLDAVSSSYLDVQGNLTIDNGSFDVTNASAGGSFISSGNVVLFRVRSFGNITGDVNALKWIGLPAGFVSKIANVTTASGDHYLVANLTFSPPPNYWAGAPGDNVWSRDTNFFNSSNAAAAPAQGQRQGRGAGGGGGGQSKQIYTVNLKTGETKSFFPSDDNLSHDNLNHFQTSPTDPNLFMFAHEGEWHQVDRIWTMHPDGSALKLMHPRTMQYEIAGHEFFSHDGKWIYYDLQTPRSDKFWIGGVNVETGERVRYPVERGQWSVHYNVSWDGKLFSGDGGGPGSVANMSPLPEARRFDPPQNGEWMYLFRPQPDKATTIQVNGENVKIIPVEAEKLADMSKHVYTNGRGVEPNATFTPDDKWLVFRSDMEGAVNVYAVEIAKASPEVAKDLTAKWDAYNAAAKAAASQK